MRESGKPDTIRAIEIAVANHWPDIERIAQHVGVTVSQVHDVVDALEDIEDFDSRGPRTLGQVASAAYVQLRKQGVPRSEMPAWVDEGVRAYRRQRYEAEKRRALRRTA